MSLPPFPYLRIRLGMACATECASRGRRARATRRVLSGLLALSLWATLGSATGDLRTTLLPFAGPFEAGSEPEVEPPVLRFGDQAPEFYSPRLIAELYAARDFEPAWDRRRAQAMLALAQQSRADGFEPADFHAEVIAAILDSGELASLDPARRDAAELLLSDALLRYVHHFRFGKLNPEHINRGGTFVKPADAEQLKIDMARALAAADMQAELQLMMPSPDFYRNLKRGYQRYLAIADRGGWSDIPGGPNLRVGAKDPRVLMIREHLGVTDGYDPGYVAEPEVYDQDLADAIKAFQRRSGLGADGIVGPNTLRALNQPLDERLLAIRANLERMRWLYNDLPPDYLFVDLTAFELYLVRDGEEVWRTKGIIGTVENQTPMFRDEMEHVVFNPTWTVPRSIEKKFRGVPTGYKRVRSGGQYYLVQQPGPRNALGRVKFMFPNGHAIYLHDTPSRYLFSRAQRAYSHGCIRVHEPLTLAQYVLNEPAWNEGAINRVVRRGSTRWVHLDEHLPVLLYYLTAKADDQGRVGFRRDIYHRDRRLLAALDGPVDGAGRIAFAEPDPDPEAAPEDRPADAEESAVAAADADESAPEPRQVAADSSAAAGAESAAEPRFADTSPTDEAHEVAGNSTNGDVAGTRSEPADDDAIAAATNEAHADAAGAAAQAVASADVAADAEDSAAPAPATTAVPAEMADGTPELKAAEEPVTDTRPAAPVDAEEPPADGTQEPTMVDISVDTSRVLTSRTPVLRLDVQQDFPGRSGAAPPAPALLPARLDLSAPEPPVHQSRTATQDAAAGAGSAAAAHIAD